MLTLKLDKQLSNTHFSAVGAFKTQSGLNGEADLLVKVVNEKQVQLDLDSNLKLSKMNGREVLLISNPKPEDVAELKEGVEFVVKNPIAVTLKK